MRIAIDARLNAYRRGGIPQYTRQLLTALSEIATEEQFVSLQHRDMLRPLAVAPNVTRRTIYTPPHHRFERWTLPFEVALARPDILHFPDFIAPTYRPCPAVVTIHDLAFMHYPQILDDAARAFYQQVLTNTHRADAVIAVSEATRQDVVQFLDVPVDDVKVVYEAAAPMFRRMDLRPGEARVLNGKPVAADTFMLFVSTLEPRKNLPTLLQALRICLDRDPSRPYKLVIVGGRGWNDEPIFEAIRDLRLADHVLLAGSVGQYDLRWLYNACQFYINPSLYEGFGLPLLEAMACGAACLAAATSSLPEIAGDAALYVPPLEPDQWADAMEALWDNTERQAELGRIGQARSQRFSWTRAARETLQIYYHAVERHEQPIAPRAPGVAPARRTAQPPQAAVVFPSAMALESMERTCLRCNTPMLPGELQQHLRIQLAGEDGSDTPVQPRAWACPNCGYAELVVEPMVVSFADAVAAIPDGDTFDEDHVPAVADDLAHDDALDEPFVAPEATGDEGSDDVAIVDEPAFIARDADAAGHEDVVSNDADDTDHENADAPVMTDEAARVVPWDEGQAAEQEPGIDVSASRDTVVLPALERDEVDHEVGVAADSAMDDSPAPRSTEVLPVLNTDVPPAEAPVNVEDQAQADLAQEPLAEPVEGDHSAVEQHDVPIAETDVFESAGAPAAEASTHAAIATQSETSDDIELPTDEADAGAGAIEHEQRVDMHAHADDVSAANGEPANGTHGVTPVAQDYRNGVSNHHDTERTPRHGAANGLKDEQFSNAPRQWHGKRHVASAKISRAANKQSSGAKDLPGAGMPRSKSRSQRKK